ncbi:HNH endonuclease signature motif containing protein [Roseovarius sp. EL26]|uniref:HNH endonuclease signature motif containing protein n=1 Tax=Roseovarius sp. EL26 TaxID=2126672 RepID=UPI000EA32C30|nr:HNH endonuclease signature motif containing protein [Roseovarius sp. EL26]
MQDVEYVKAVLSENYSTERSHEIPYPALEEVIEQTPFNYIDGIVEGETPNGSKSREGQDYYWFQHEGKSILSHRFIAAVTIGKWVPRDFDVDHINHNPSDNRPSNLRVVTRRDNAGNRRRALLSDLADLEHVAEVLKERRQKQEPELEPELASNLEFRETSENDDSFAHSSDSMLTYTGETKPANDGYKWYRTNIGSWHLRRG